MEITRTINADKRYYIDEDTMTNADSLIDTIRMFNDIQMQMYNLLYEKKYMDSGILTKQTYSNWCKDTFGTSDYYNCAVYTRASGMLSSQKELRSLHIRTKEADLKARDTKIKSTGQQLAKKQAIKDAIVLYIKTGKWKTPYTGCQTRVAGKNVKLPGNKTIPIETYEYKIEADIRSLKTRLKLLTSARNRVQAKLDNLREHPPKRIVFGSKKMYSCKDNNDTDIAAWKRAFYDKRHSSMTLPGRHTSKDCNFLVKKRKDALVITCMDGSQTILSDFKLARDNDIWLSMLSAKPEDRKPVCYNFQLKRDHVGRLYLIPSVTLLLENRYCNESLEDGCVSIDLNYDHVVLTDIDKNGTRISGETMRFNPENKTSGQISNEIGRIMSKVGKYCEDRKKPLIMEDINTTISKHGMKYGNAKGNRHASVFAYRKMTSCLENQAYKRSFGILKIDPAYTSQIGKILYMRKLGISVHAAASYVIGLKGMGILEKLLPMPELTERLTPSLKEGLADNKNMDSIMKAWRYISGKFSGVYTHSFYRQIPYAYKKSEAFTKSGKPRKPKSLSAIASEMKRWTDCNY